MLCSTLVTYLSLEPAVFVKKLSDQYVEPGKPIILEGTYTGSLPISVTWKKNGHTVTQSQKCSITTTEKSCILEILDSTKEDAGEYTCHVENEAGRDVCEAVVSTLGVCSLCFFSLPFFSSVSVGSYTTLQCHVAGTPEITDDHNVHTSFVDNVAVLQLVQTEMNHTGQYSCTATNSVGTATSSARLTVAGVVALSLIAIAIWKVISKYSSTLHLLACCIGNSFEFAEDFSWSSELLI
uniref:Ig-like domain-containing protein n=1 Tax=Cyanoderma ruficeps TaxID=181631 RepID=A0A8C3R654_9PASS